MSEINTNLHEESDRAWAFRRVEFCARAIANHEERMVGVYARRRAREAGALPQFPVTLHLPEMPCPVDTVPALVGITVPAHPRIVSIGNGLHVRTRRTA